MTSQERIEAHLRRNVGVSFCAACVADAVGVPATLGRAVVWMLLALPDYQMLEHECGACHRVKRVIRYVDGETAVALAHR